jgi:hypothetical protein
MLTVNIQVSDTQLTLEARQAKAVSAKVGGTYDAVELTKPDGEIYVIKDGRVFIMNEAGATVAKYDLNRPKAIHAGQKAA